MKAKNILIILAVTAVGALILSVLSGLDLPALRAFYSDTIPEGIREFLWEVRSGYSQLLVYLVVIGAFALERAFPTDRNQPMFHAGLAQDFFWFNAVMLTSWTLIVLYTGFFAGLYERYFNFLTVRAAAGWPVWVRVLATLLIFDLLRWFHHFLKHKIRYIWFFHGIHHSQTRMNFFTNQRIHIVESLFAHSVIFIPMFMLGLPNKEIFAVAFFVKWYPYFYHANIRTNWGPLKHILVSPQSHRIHHSPRPEHQDKNFGVIFTFWDRIFGTLYKNYDVYPETGIRDKDFPVEQSIRGFSILTNYLKQLIYPFQQVYRSLVKKAELVPVASDAR